MRPRRVNVRTSPLSSDCLFCRIVVGDLAATIVTETAATVSFLDHRPLFPGHTLVVPRAHVVTLRDLAPDDVGPFFAEVRRVAIGVQDGLDAQGTLVAENNVVSQSVPHLHVHVVPRRRKDGLRGFFWPRHPYEDPSEMGLVAARIRRALPE
jgi:histidine triad (HIT) family protein